MYEKLVRVMQQTNADIVECQAETVYQDKMYVQQDASFDISELSGYDALEKLMRHVKSEFPRYAVWNKLFRREILYNLNFPVGEIHEDYFFDAVAFLRAKKYVLLNQQLYCHRIRSHSITTTPFNPHDYDKLKHIEQRTVYLLENGWEQLAQYSNTEYYETLLLYYYKAYKAKQMTECDKIKNEIKKSRIKIQNSMLSFKRKCEFKLFYSSPWIFVKYIDLKNRLFKMLKKVGDAPMQECRLDKLIKESGYDKLVMYCNSVFKGVDVQLIDFRYIHSEVRKGVYCYLENDESQGILIDLILKQHHNDAKNEYFVNRHILEADVIINMPKPKTHRKFWKARWYSLLSRMNSWMARYFLKDDYREGSWYGNHIISKTIVDLNSLFNR